MPQLHLIAGAVEPPPSRPQGRQWARSLWVLTIMWRARAHHALDAEPAAMAAGAAGIRHQRVALDHKRKFDLGLLVRAVVGVAVVDADRGGDAVLAQLGAPAAAERTETGDEEFAGPRIDAVERRRQQVGMMTGDHAVRESPAPAP